jgi:tRNA-dihydrouridine synthase
MGKLFLSSMMGITDGAWCATRSTGCSMVQLGAYLAEPEATAEEMGRDAASFLPADPEACVSLLAEDCAQARRTSDLTVCLNLATPRLEWALQAARCFHQAGGDLLELNAHGGYKRYLDQGKLRANVLPEHRGELVRWSEALCTLEIPLIVKVNAQHDRPDVCRALEALSILPLWGVHINVRDPESEAPDLAFVREAREWVPGKLLVSGYVRSAADVQACLEAGADSVGIAAPAIDDADYIGRIAGEL